MTSISCKTSSKIRPKNLTSDEDIVLFTFHFNLLNLKQEEEVTGGMKKYKKYFVYIY